MSFAYILYTIILYPIVQIIEISYKIFDKLFDNTGIAVIGVSLTVTLLCLPLYIVAEKWQQIERDTQSKLKPGIDRIKQTFKGDEQYMILSTFYKQNHYHPMMALRSSFGLLIQIPFFMAAYSCLSKLPALQGQSFLFIRDMGQQDAIFRIGTFPVNILPVAMTIINIIAGAIYTKGFAFKEKLQIYGMALLFLVVLYTSPAGLVLYWTMNNVFSLIKNIFYKFKKPGKTLYYCALACCILGEIFILFLYQTKIANKIIATLFFLFISAIPLYVKFFVKQLNTKLSVLTENSKARTSLFFSSCVLLLILTALSIPSSLIGSSPSEFCGIGNYTTPYFIFKNVFVQAFGLLIFWTTCIYFLFEKRIQTLLAVFFSFTALSAVADVFIFQGNYGDISQTLRFLNVTDFSTFGLKSIINILFILAVFCSLCLFGPLKKGRALNYITILLSFALLVSSIPNFIYIRKETNNYLVNANTEKLTDIKPVFNLSKNNPNVILLFLDRAQARYLPEMLKEDTSLKSRFSGFVNYPQVLSYNGHTIMGAPGLFGGYEYTPFEMNKRSNEPLVQKNNEALLMLPRVFNEQLNYTSLITDPSWANYNTFIDISIVNNFPNLKAAKTEGAYNDLWYKSNAESDFAKNNEIILKRNMLYFALFREVPICLREFIYYKGTYWSADEELNDMSTLIDSYATLDFLNELTSISETSDGTFTSITNELTHESCYLQAPDYIPVMKVTDYGSSIYSKDNSYHTQIAAFKMLADWFDYLKAKDVYDNTRIVIVSDHGGSGFEKEFENDSELDSRVSGTRYSGRGHYHCLLMFKDFNADGDLKDDNTFMTNADTPSLLLKGLGDSFTNPFTNKTIPLYTNKFKENGIYITTSDAHQPLYNGTYQFSIKDNEWWHVKENIFESKNWTQEAPRD